MNSISPRFPASGAFDIPGVDLSRAFSAVAVDELRQALATDPVFATYFDEEMAGTSPETLDSWLSDLADAVNTTTATMPYAHKGCEFVFRFRKAYGEVHHVALGTVWRAKGGELRCGLAHQESFLHSTRGLRGQVFDTFDTSVKLKGKTPPVLASLRDHGLPDVAVRSCAEPSNVSLATWLSDPCCEHPYGFFGEEDEQGFRALTCFSITAALHNAVHGRWAGVDTDSSISAFETLMQDVFGKDSLRSYPLFSSDVRKLDAKALFKAALETAKNWGEKETWSVTPQT